MISSCDTTLEEDISSNLSDGKTVIVMSGSKQCINCQLTRHNIMQFITLEPNNSISFISIDNTENDLIESKYYQLNEIEEYPKTVIYYGSDNISFRGGIITVTDLEKYNKVKH